MNPVDIKNIGALYNEEQPLLWKVLYDYFKMDEEHIPCVTTSISKEQIYPYYNAGMFVVKQPRNLFTDTKQSIIELLEHNDIKNLLKSSQLNRIFIHQAIFSCMVLKKYEDKISPLPYGVNYPLHLHAKNPTKVPFSEIISIRYDDYFDSNPSPEIWNNTFKGKEKDLKSYWYY